MRKCGVLLALMAVVAVVGTAVVHAYPVPVVVVYGARNPLSVLEVVTVDASGSYDSSPNANLSFAFDFGEGLAPVWTAVPVQTVVYATPGVRVIVVTVNNRNSSDGVTVEGRPAPSASTKVAIVDRPSCYYYSVAGEEAGGIVRDDAEDGTFNLYAQVTIHAGSPASTRQRLTREFADLGEYPVATFSNSTKSISFNFSYPLDAATQSWKAMVDLSLLADSAELFTLTVSGHGMVVMSCSVADSVFQWMPLTFKGVLGTIVSTGSPVGGPAGVMACVNASGSAFVVACGDASDGDAINTPQGLSIAAGNFTPTGLYFSTDPCTYSAAAAVFGKSPYLVLSNNIFGSSTRVVDLSNTMCKALGSGTCDASFRPLSGTFDLIASAVVTCVDALIVVSNRGVFVGSALLKSGTSSLVAVTASMPSALRAVFADGTSTNATTTKLFGPLRCEPGFPEKYVAYVVYTPASPATNGIISLVAKSSPPFTAWTQLAVSAASLGLDASVKLRVVEISRDNDLKNNVMLITRMDGTHASVAVVPDVGTPTVTFTFPPTLVFEGLRIHANGYNMYAFGSTLWLSTDGGSNFRSLLRLPEADIAIDFLSSTGLEAFSLFASSGAVYYGRAGSLSLVRAREAIAHSGRSPVLEAGVIDNQGDVFVFQLPVPLGAYPSSPSLYPIGLLDKPDGTVAKSPFKKTMLPTVSAARSDDEAFDAALAIAPLFFDRLYVFPVGPVATRPNGDQSDEFDAADVGRWLVQATGAFDFGGTAFFSDGQRGVASLRSVVQLGVRNVAICDTRSPLRSVAAADSPAVGYTLTVVGPSYTVLGTQPLYGFTSGAQAYPGSPGNRDIVSLQLGGLGVGDEGWLRSDVGKSVSLANGAYVIVHYVNSTNVDALTVAPAPYLRSPFGVGEWQMYDFRSFFEYASVSSQGVTVSGSGASLVVVLDAGYMAFAPGHVGMVLGATDGTNTQPGYTAAVLTWGVIRGVVNGTAAVVDGVDGGLQAGYLAAGNWTLYAIAAGSSAATLPHVRARPWRLVVGECPYMELTTVGSSRRLLFLDYGESTVLSAQLTRTLVHADASLANTAVGLFAGMTNPGLVQFKSNATLRGVGVRTIKMQLQLSERAQQGSVSILVRPPDATLMCTATSLDWRVVVGCPPDRQFVWVWPYDLTREQFLLGNVERAPGRAAVIDLPANYRPPSPQGRGVPTASRFYNAYPELPKHYNDFRISRETGTYNMCLGKTRRADCGCTDDLRMSSALGTTDCQDRIITARYSDKFHPVFNVLKEGVPPEVFVGSYVMTEVNGRLDWSTDGHTVGPNGESILTSDTSLVFSGWQLFHFSISVITANTTYCTLQSDIKIYVTDPPLTSTVMFISVSITGALFAGLIFAAYLWHHNSHKNSY